MLEENRDIIKEAQEQMMEWNIYEFENLPDTVKVFKELLEEFYEEHGNHPQDPTNFSARVKLSGDAEEELAQLAEAFLNDKGTDTDIYTDLLMDPTREDWRERYNLETMEDVVSFLNTMEEYKNDALMREILSSDQIMELYSEANKKGLTDREINNIIYSEYSLSGLEDEDLYTQIWGSIKRYDARSNSW